MPAPAAPPVQCENSCLIDLTRASAYENLPSLVFCACGTCRRKCHGSASMVFRGIFELGAFMFFIVTA